MLFKQHGNRIAGGHSGHSDPAEQSDRDRHRHGGFLIKPNEDKTVKYDYFDNDERTRFA
jgi:hypothetical protein